MPGALNLTIRKTARELLTELKHHFIGNPENCELVERGQREKRAKLFISALIFLPEITRFVIKVVLG